MTRRGLILAGAVLILLSAFWGLAGSRVALSDILRGPIMALLGSQQQLNAKLLDVSENGEPFSAAGRRLLQPFGKVRLVKVLTFQDKESESTPRR